MKLWELGNKIGELSFELLHPQGYTFADSFKDMVEENTDEDGFTSYIGGRSVRMMLSGKGRMKHLMEITDK